MEIVFVGTSDAFGAGGRRQTAILVRTAGGSLLLDCGPTTNTGLEALGISRDEIDAIVLTHFHGDHFGGIPLLLLAARYEDQRTRPMHIVGPPGVEQRVRALAAAMGHPVDVDDWSFPIPFHELEAGAEMALGPGVVRAFGVNHNVDANPHGLWIEAEGKRVAFSGDTGWFDDLPEQVRGADLFICECTHYDHEYKYHLRYMELSARKASFDCRRMILTHFGAEMTDLRGRCGFETADDGMRFKL